eukprot:5090632-Amphidinium_carterae.1
MRSLETKSFFQSAFSSRSSYRLTERWQKTTFRATCGPKIAMAGAGQLIQQQQLALRRYVQSLHSHAVVDGESGEPPCSCASATLAIRLVG